jgi:hypothetical protein
MLALTRLTPRLLTISSQDPLAYYTASRPSGWLTRYQQRLKSKPGLVFKCRTSNPSVVLSEVVQVSLS